MSDAPQQTHDSGEPPQARSLDGMDMPPGSDVAAQHGCTCPRMDNSCGKGYMCIAGVFVMTENCPLHGAGRHIDKMSDSRREKP